MSANDDVFDVFIPEDVELGFFCDTVPLMFEDGTLTPVCTLNGWHVVIYLSLDTDAANPKYIVWFGNGFAPEEHPSLARAILAARAMGRRKGIELRRVNSLGDIHGMGFLRTDEDTTLANSRYCVRHVLNGGIHERFELVFLSDMLGEDEWIVFFAKTLPEVIGHWQTMV